MTTYTAAEQLGLALILVCLIGGAILVGLVLRRQSWRIEHLEHAYRSEAEARKVLARRMTEAERQADALVVAIASVEDGRTVLTGHVIDLAETLSRSLTAVDTLTPRPPAVRRMRSDDWL